MINPAPIPDLGTDEGWVNEGSALINSSQVSTAQVLKQLQSLGALSQAGLQFQLWINICKGDTLGREKMNFLGGRAGLLGQLCLGGPGEDPEGLGGSGRGDTAGTSQGSQGVSQGWAWGAGVTWGVRRRNAELRGVQSSFFGIS